MSKSNQTLIDRMVPTRTAQRLQLVASIEDTPQSRRRQPSRVKTVMIAGHFDSDVSFAIHELCGKLTRKQGKRMTVQQALSEALSDWFSKHGATPPSGLKQ